MTNADSILEHAQLHIFSPEFQAQWGKEVCHEAFDTLAHARYMVGAEADSQLRFFWNGIKVGKGKLQRCSYSDAPLISLPAGTLTIYAKDSFSREVWAELIVNNDTDLTTDLFCKDIARVLPSHPLYAKVKAAKDARHAHYNPPTAHAHDFTLGADDIIRCACGVSV